MVAAALVHNSWDRNGDACVAAVVDIVAGIAARTHGLVGSRNALAACDTVACTAAAYKSVVASRCHYDEKNKYKTKSEHLKSHLPQQAWNS